MEGDKVSVKVEMVEKNGNYFTTKELSSRPQFMMEDDYKLLLISCARKAVKAVCDFCYPNNMEEQEMLAKAIAKKAMEEQDG